jgi:hypothetical protein
MANLELTIVFITAIASLLVATISLIATVISNRQNARSAKMIENLKHEYSRTETSEAFSDE